MRATVLLILILLSTTALSNQHSVTQKIFQVQSQVLGNGLHVIRHHRNDSDTFTAQVVVELGLQDFDCEKKQAPHLLEHMVFEGTQRFDAKALRQRVRDHGGKTRAFTVEEYTHYTLSVHSDYPHIALENLYSMMAEALFNENAFTLSQQIIHTEMGTNNGINPLWANAKVLTETAKSKLYSDSELYCSYLPNPNAVTLEETVELYNKRYLASNMTLILLGHFDDHTVDAIINRTFATMAKRPTPERAPSPTPNPDYTPLRERSTAFDPQAELYLYVPAVGESHPDAKAFELISEYFSEQLYYEVRGKRGLGYTPRAQLKNNSAAGVIQATTRTNDRLLEEAEAAFLDVYARLINEGIAAEEVERLKRKLILEFESQQRNHHSLAQLYRHHRNTIKHQGTMPNLVKTIEQVNQAQVNNLLSTFPPQPLIATLARPAMTKMLLYVILISVIATTLAWPLLRWARKSQQAR